MSFAAPPARIGGGTIDNMRPARIPDGGIDFFQASSVQPPTSYSKTAANGYVPIPAQVPVLSPPYNADLALGSYMFSEQVVGRPRVFERLDAARGVAGSVTAVAKTLSSVNYELAHTDEIFPTAEDVLNRYKPFGPNMTQGLTESQKRRDQKIVVGTQGAVRIIDYWGARYEPGLVAALLLFSIPAGQEMSQKRPTGDSETFRLVHATWQFVPIVATAVQLANYRGDMLVLRVGKITCSKRSANMLPINQNPTELLRTIDTVIADLHAVPPGGASEAVTRLPLWHPNVTEGLIDIAI